MRCPACGTENAAAARFCTGCGSALPAPPVVVEAPVAALPRHCTQCGAQLAPGARFCTGCGASVDAASAPAAPVAQAMPIAPVTPGAPVASVVAYEAAPVVPPAALPPEMPAAYAAAQAVPPAAPPPGAPNGAGYGPAAMPEAAPVAMPAGVQEAAPVAFATTPIEIETSAPAPSGGFLQAWSALTREPTGIGQAVIVLAVCGLFTSLLWLPLARPSTWVLRFLPIPDCGQLPRANVQAVETCAMQVAASSLGGPILFVVLLTGLGWPLAKVTPWLMARLPESISFLLAPFLATLMFALPWAGSHVGRPSQPPLIPHPAFPALAGFAAFATFRWGPRLWQLLDPVIALRDRVPAWARFALVLVIPMVFPLLLSQRPADEARNEQLTVIVGMLISFGLLAPRNPPVDIAALLAAEQAEQPLEPPAPPAPVPQPQVAATQG